MKLSLAILTSLLVATPAVAANQGKDSHCIPMAKLKTQLDSQLEGKTHWTTLTPGQYHFVEGLYVGLPSTPEGFPPGEGVALVQKDGSADGVLVWTMGSLACSPMMVPEKIVKMINAVKTGKTGADGTEL